MVPSFPEVSSLPYSQLRPSADSSQSCPVSLTCATRPIPVKDNGANTKELLLLEGRRRRRVGGVGRSGGGGGGGHRRINGHVRGPRVVVPFKVKPGEWDYGNLSGHRYVGSKTVSRVRFTDLSPGRETCRAVCTRCFNRIDRPSRLETVYIFLSTSAARQHSAGRFHRNYSGC